VSSSPLHAGTPTDRFVAEWRLNEPHVKRRIFGSGLLVRDGSVASAPVINPSRDGVDWIQPGKADLGADARRVLVEIPTGFTEMMRSAPGLALEWRMNTREVFTTYFHRGYRAVDFFLSREARRGQYLLARND
jgi:chorismate synthase